MPSGVLQRPQRLAIGQDNRPIEALIPRHDPTLQLEPRDSKLGRNFRSPLPLRFYVSEANAAVACSVLQPRRTH